MTGFIVVDKERGVTSAREVAAVKRLTGVPCGHMGTLDPLATGVLPVAIGNASRLFEYFKDKQKTYIATFRFGVGSDTLDITGNLSNFGSPIPKEEEISAALGKFTGEIMQIPPKYSAKSLNGRRGYELARMGVDFELQPKRVTVYSFRMIERVSEYEWSFEIVCGGGTYIRSLARDLGGALGTCAVMSGLVRTRSGVFDISSAVKTCELSSENISEYIIPTDSVLDLKSFYPTESEAKRLLNGVPTECALEDGLYKLYTAEKRFYGLAEVKNGVIKAGTKLC